MLATEIRTKPTLRGVFHELGFYAALGLGVALVLTADPGRARVSAVVFASCVAACFGASMGFMFPVGTPPNAIVYGTGLIPITSMMRVGVVVDVLGFFVIFAVLRLLCPLLGMA